MDTAVKAVSFIRAKWEDRANVREPESWSRALSRALRARGHRGAVQADQVAENAHRMTALT